MPDCHVHVHRLGRSSTQSLHPSVSQGRLLGKNCGIIEEHALGQSPLLLLPQDTKVREAAIHEILLSPGLKGLPFLDTRATSGIASRLPETVVSGTKPSDHWSRARSWRCSSQFVRSVRAMTAETDIPHRSGPCDLKVSPGPDVPRRLHRLYLDHRHDLLPFPDSPQHAIPPCPRSWGPSYSTSSNYRG